jgi:hypothetical protein
MLPENAPHRIPTAFRTAPMTGQQAECLERIAFNHYDEFYFPLSIFADSFLEFAEYNIRGEFESEIRNTLTDDGRINATFEKIQRAFSRPGVFLEVALIGNEKGEFWEGYDSVAKTGIRQESDLSILESLGLVRYVVLRVTISLKRKSGGFKVWVNYHHLTNLGVEFCEVCSRARLNELEKITIASQKKGRERQSIFDR